MDGFKNSSKTQYMKGGSAKGEAKMGKVMHEFATGKLHSGSKKGPAVTNKKQAVAIAMSEARKAGAKMPVKKARGGMMDEGVSGRPTDKYGRRITLAEMDIGPVKEAPKKPIGKGLGAVSAALGEAKKLADMAKKVVPAKEMNSNREARKGVPAYDGRPMIRRKAGGLATMPKGKC